MEGTRQEEPEVRRRRGKRRRPLGRILVAAAAAAAGLVAGAAAAAAVLAGGDFGAAAGAGGCGCPRGWLGFGGRCYLFSEEEGNWSRGLGRCRDLGGSLTSLDTPEEKGLLARHKGLPHHWVGLWRDPQHRWRWANGSHSQPWFAVRGGADCAYLGDRDGAVQTASCASEKHWICARAPA
ncbi:C-type lectin domain family 2 member B-like [Grus americana]|uniref:C-type lectin domain family 2 member B-like n=1 Tax=Grus americana TaxID=9117 RepID=UPI0024085D05|nr:C-type lectin domain family 2 member B-like [Grus americana]XP_054663616.1 C-type lectin domain family 2 member B-like [Grus americana]